MSLSSEAEIALKACGNPFSLLKNIHGLPINFSAKRSLVMATAFVRILTFALCLTVSLVNERDRIRPVSISTESTLNASVDFELFVACMCLFFLSFVKIISASNIFSTILRADEIS